MLIKSDIEAIFAEEFVVGDIQPNMPLWPLFAKNPVEPEAKPELAAYVFETVDFEPVRGYGGKPINVLVAMDLKGNFELTPLPGSEREVRDIAQKLDGKKWATAVFTGTEATEDNLKKVKSPKVLHLATHGYILNTEKQTDFKGFKRAQTDKNPAIRSMLCFTGAEDAIEGKYIPGQSDGILNAYEASVLQLEGTELVVLSACNTGLGKIQHGEGVYGLQRAFRIAGAKSLIMSFWEVEDAATALLMTTFYENWTSGMSKPDAFRKAQLALKAKYPQPFYWGSFVLVNG
jgi:CHAT domain-containing protein